jgi:hypothetical protein
MISDKTEPKHTMIRYLLGEMSDQERASFEDKYQGDESLFHEIVELENDLIDLYALGALSEAERKQLEQSFLADPDRNRRLTFARTLASYPQSGPDSLPQRLAESGARPRFWQRSKQLAMRAAAAAVLIAMMAGISRLLIESHDLRKELEELRNQRSSTLQRAQILQQQVDDFRRELEARSNTDKQIAEVRPPNTASFRLRADVLRGNGEVPTLTVPPSAAFVALQMTFPSDSSHNSYDLSLETADGGSIWRQHHVKGRSAGGGNTRITMKLPSRTLKDGDYALRVTTTIGQEVEDMAGYSFRVIHH